MTDAPIIAKLDDIDQSTATQAFAGTSFTPEKRGEARREGYVEAVNGLYTELWPLAETDAQKDLLAEEMERYRQGYVKHLTAYLHSHASVVSAMIAGPAKFPVARIEKRGRWADSKASELTDWDERARKAIKEKLLDARPQEAKDDAAWQTLKADIDRTLGTVKDIDTGAARGYSRTLFTSNLAGRLERVAQAGEVELIDKALTYLKEHNSDSGKAVFTARHKVWSFGDVAKEARARHDAAAGKQAELLGEAEEVELWANYRLDRVQLMFKEKPGFEMRESLKRSGWRWAPSEEAWQRQLTAAGIASGKAIVEGSRPGREAGGRLME